MKSRHLTYSSPHFFIPSLLHPLTSSSPHFFIPSLLHPLTYLFPNLSSPFLSSNQQSSTCTKRTTRRSPARSRGCAHSSAGWTPVRLSRRTFPLKCLASASASSPSPSLGCVLTFSVLSHLSFFSLCVCPGPLWSSFVTPRNLFFRSTKWIVSSKF